MEISEDSESEDGYDVSHWIYLYNVYGHRFSPAENYRNFRSFTGVLPQVAERIFLRYENDYELRTRLHLLMVLHYLKRAPTENSAAEIFKISRPTYRKILWNALVYLNNAMDEIQLDNRVLPYVPMHGPFANIALVVDGTECAIDRPSTRAVRNLYSSGRNKENSYGRYCVKYTVAVQIVTGKICFVSSPQPGSVNDISALRRCSLVDNLEEGEIILGDKGYQGHYCCLTPVKGRDLTLLDEVYNEVHASVRQIVECIFERIKIFYVLKKRFAPQRWKHRLVFNVCAQVTNVSLEFEPVYRQINRYIAG